MTLSPFQIEKLEYYYRFIVGPNAVMLNEESMAKFNERIIEYTGWESNSTEAKQCLEIHDTFYEILCDRVKDEDDSPVVDIPMNTWLSIWASMLQGVMGMHNLPIYIRLLPQELFKIIDRRGEGTLNAADLDKFYQDMVHLDPSQANQTALKAYEQMTDAGRYPLNNQGYEQLFANFLIGRTPYGPGRYIFGCFEHEVQPFQLIQPLPDPEDEEDMEMPIRRPVGRRPSKQLTRPVTLTL